MDKKSGGTPLVLKILVVIAILGALAIGGLIWFASSLVTFDKATVQKRAESMVTFKGSLPSDFVYRFGASVGDLTLIEIEHKPAEQEIYIASTSSKNQSTDPDEILTKLSAPSDKGASKFKSQSKDSLKVGSETLQYEIGTVSRSSKAGTEETPAFIGVCPKDSAGHAIFVFVGQRTGSSFDMKPIQTLLDDVVSFK